MPEAWEQGSPTTVGMRHFPIGHGEMKKREARSALFSGAMGLAILFQTDWQGTEDGGLWARLMGVVVIYLGYRFIRAGIRTHSTRSEGIELRGDGLFLPAVLVGFRPRLIPWAQLRLAVAFRSRDGGVLVLADHRDTYRIDSVDLGSWFRLEALVEGVYSYTTVNPHQKAVMIAEAERFQRGQVRRGAKPVVTHGLLGLIGLVYCLELYLDAVAWDSILSADIVMLARMGANAQFLVEMGAFDRWCTAAFLHVGWVHIASNAFGLFCVGILAEWTMGRARLLLVYFGSALAASAASTYLAAGLVSAGASGAIFGVLGACFYVQLFATNRMPYSLSIRGRAIRAWAVVFVLNIAIPVILPMVDYMAHLAGFIAGFTILAACGRENIRRGRNAGFYIQALVVILLGTFAAAGIIRASQFDGEDDLGQRLLASIQPDSMAKRDLLNGWSWSIVVDGEAELTEIRNAAAAMRRVNAGGARADYLDTEASLRHRLGDAAAAVRLQRKAWQASHDSGVAAEVRDGFWASQLLCFLRGQPPAEHGISVTGRDMGLVLEGTGLKTVDSEVYIAVHGPRSLLGIIRVVLPPTETLRYAVDRVPGLPTIAQRFSLLGQYPRLRLRGVEDARYWPIDSRVAQLWPDLVRPAP